MRISVEALRRIRNRSVPLPPPFDPGTLPDNALLTAKELAGWLRLSVSTLETWRLRCPDRGPPWVLVAGLPRYRMGDVRRWLLAGKTEHAPSVLFSPGTEVRATNQ